MVSNKLTTKRIDGILIVTDGCNMGCVYCYRHDCAKPAIMNKTALRNTLMKLAEHNREEKSTTLMLHGGEPLLAGIDFYKQLVELEQSFEGHRFFNRIQTNGTLLDSNYIEFFKKYNFRVGFSLDGIAETHDRNRPNYDGTPSFNRVFDNVTRAKEAGIGGGVICVLNKNTLEHIAEIYNFFKQNSIHFQVNIQFPLGKALNCADLALTPKDAGRGLINLFDRWFNDLTKPSIKIDPFVFMMANIGLLRNNRNTLDRTNGPIGCCYNNGCSDSYIAVVPDGDAYPCSRYSEIPEFRLGNINTDSIEALQQSGPKQLLLKRKLEGNQVCSRCEYVRVCNSGCPMVAHLVRGDILERDGYCTTNRMLFNHIDAAMSAQVEKELNQMEVKK